MLRMESVQKDVLDEIEQTLRTEFMSNLARTSKRDAHEVMAEIFNNFDRQTEARFITALEESSNREFGERIKAPDVHLRGPGQARFRRRADAAAPVDKDKLAVALKGASEVKGFFICNMSERAGKMLKRRHGRDGSRAPARCRRGTVVLVNVAKDLAAKGEITLTKNCADDELVY